MTNPTASTPMTVYSRYEANLAADHGTIAAESPDPKRFGEDYTWSALGRSSLGCSKRPNRARVPERRRDCRWPNPLHALGRRLVAQVGAVREVPGKAGQVRVESR